MGAPRISFANVFARDLDGLFGFYRSLFGFAEVEALRSPIFRCLDGNGLRFGFHALGAYELLNLSDRARRDGSVTCYLTIEVANEDAVEHFVARAVDSGARIVKAPYVTYYDSYQCVLADPEDNVFRINHQRPARD